MQHDQATFMLYSSPSLTPQLKTTWKMIVGYGPKGKGTNVSQCHKGQGFMERRH
jgi:hypothetical protein